LPPSKPFRGKEMVVDCQVELGAVDGGEWTGYVGEVGSARVLWHFDVGGGSGRAYSRRGVYEGYTVAARDNGVVIWLRGREPDYSRFPINGPLLEISKHTPTYPLLATNYVATKKQAIK
jgi:hypothetical protein